MCEIVPLTAVLNNSPDIPCLQKEVFLCRHTEKQFAHLCVVAENYLTLHWIRHLFTKALTKHNWYFYVDRVQS